MNGMNWIAPKWNGIKMKRNGTKRNEWKGSRDSLNFNAKQKLILMLDLHWWTAFTLWATNCNSLMDITHRLNVTVTFHSSDHNGWQFRLVRWLIQSASLSLLFVLQTVNIFTELKNEFHWCRKCAAQFRQLSGMNRWRRMKESEKSRIIELVSSYFV